MVSHMIVEPDKKLTVRLILKKIFSLLQSSAERFGKTNRDQQSDLLLLFFKVICL